MGLPLRDKQATQVHTVLSLHELNKRCAVTSPQQTLKEMIRLVTGAAAPHLFLCHLWTETLAAKFVLHATTHSYYTIVIEIWAMLLNTEWHIEYIIV